MKKVILLFILIFSMTNCSTEDSARLSELEPKTLLVQTNTVVDMIQVDIKDINGNTLETDVVSNTLLHVFNIDKGTNFQLTITANNKTFSGSYQLTEDYGNVILLQDAFTNYYQTFSANEEY